MYILICMIVAKWLVSMRCLAATMYWSRDWVRCRLDWQRMFVFGVCRLSFMKMIEWLNVTTTTTTAMQFVWCVAV
jgi:hypothetical protein